MACNDQHFGYAWNLHRAGPRRQTWATAGKRAAGASPGNDWAILALGHAGQSARVEVDTAHFKGNYPGPLLDAGGAVNGGTDESLVTQSMFWRTLLPEQKLQMDHQHFFERELIDLGPVTHVRVNMFPDGGDEPPAAVSARLPGRDADVASLIIPVAPLTREAFAPSAT